MTGGNEGMNLDGMGTRSPLFSLESRLVEGRAAAEVDTAAAASANCWSATVKRCADEAGISSSPAMLAGGAGDSGGDDASESGGEGLRISLGDAATASGGGAGGDDAIVR